MFFLGSSDDESSNIPRFLLQSIPELSRIFIPLEKIGEGTFSKVYKAKLIKDHTKEFALKCVIPTIKSERVASELRYLRDLGGDSNIIGVKACLFGNGFSVIVMPYFKHDRFMDVMKNMNATEIRDYMKNLFISLNKVHKYGIIHRDVKPSNFLYNRKTKRYGLVDFGLAQSEKSLHRQSKSIDAQVKGKHKINREVLKDSTKTTANYVLTKDDSNLILVKKRSFQEVDENEKHLPNKRIKSSQLISKASVFNTPVTPKKYSNDTEDDPFKTPVKKFTPKENLITPNTPVKVIPETPPKSNKTDGIKTPTTAVRQKYINETPISRLEKKFSSNQASTPCSCLGKGQVCLVCARRAELVAPRAGTPGFRAPEVLLRYFNQTTAIDIWSAGVILASLLSRRYPFFRNTDDLTSLAEIVTVLGAKRVMKAAKELNRGLVFSVKSKPALDLKELCELLRGKNELTIDDSAYDLLNRLLEPNPRKRLTAEEALRHPFIISRN